MCMRLYVYTLKLALTDTINHAIMIPLDNGPEAPPPNTKAGGDSMTNVEIFFGLIAVASLALTIYFGSKR